MARLLALLVLLVSAASGAAAAERWRLLADYRIPSGLSIAGVPFGGLSSLGYDPVGGRFTAVSDDPGRRGAMRFYQFTAAVDPKQGPRRAVRGFDILGWTALRGPGGAAIAADMADFEAMLRLPDGRFYAASEGGRSGAPGVFLFDAPKDGASAQAAAFDVPDYHKPATGADGKPIGARPNRSYEALAVLADGRVAVGLESALHQDGPLATLTRGAAARITLFDPETRKPVAEHVYEIDPIAQAPAPADGFADAGLVALLADPAGGLFALERSFSVGRGTTVKLYRTGFEGATDVLGRAQLDGAGVLGMRKTLLYTFQSGAVFDHVDNLEGLTFGPVIDEKPTLALISDDNFNPRAQLTQFILLIRE